MGDPVFDSGKLTAFTFSFTHMRNSINALPGFTAPAQAIVTALVAALNTTLMTPTTRFEPSLISAVGHTMEAAGAGVALTKIPPARNALRMQDTIRQTNGGVVICDAADNKGNRIFAGGLEYKAETGELSGPPFTDAVRRIASRVATSRSF